MHRLVASFFGQGEGGPQVRGGEVIPTPRPTAMTRGLGDAATMGHSTIAASLAGVYHLVVLPSWPEVAGTEVGAVGPAPHSGGGSSSRGNSWWLVGEICPGSRFTGLQGAALPAAQHSSSSRAPLSSSLYGRLLRAQHCRATTMPLVPRLCTPRSVQPQKPSSSRPLHATTCHNHNHNPAPTSCPLCKASCHLVTRPSSSTETRPGAPCT